MLRRQSQILIIFSTILFFAFLAWAQRSPSELQQQAMQNIVRAEKITAYANALMEAKPDRQIAEVFLTLYLEAAQLYGDAARLLKALGSGYVRQEIIDQFAQAEHNCLQNVDEVRRMLNQGEITRVPSHDMKYLMQQLEEATK